MDEKRDKDMVIKREDPQKITSSNKKVQESAEKVLKKYEKLFEKLAKH